MAKYNRQKFVIATLTRVLREELEALRPLVERKLHCAWKASLNEIIGFLLSEFKQSITYQLETVIGFTSRLEVGTGFDLQRSARASFDLG